MLIPVIERVALECCLQQLHSYSLRSLIREDEGKIHSDVNYIICSHSDIIIEHRTRHLDIDSHSSPISQQSKRELSNWPKCHTAYKGELGFKFKELDDSQKPMQSKQSQAQKRLAE